VLMSRYLVVSGPRGNSSVNQSGASAMAMGTP
jgi:hypothetical protein